MTKPTLICDFDGVLHSYTSGWKGADVVSDPPVPGAIEFLREATKHFVVAIYSSRSGQPGGIGAMKEWLRTYGGGSLDITFPIEKPAAFLTIDDRAYLFTGTFPDPASLLSFKPWNAK